MNVRLLICLLLVVVTCIGCHSEQTVDEVAILVAAMEKDGKIDAAILPFQNESFERLLKKSDVACLKISESEFMSFSPKKREEIQNEAIKVSQALKRVAHVCAQKEETRKIAQDLGRALDSNKKLMVIQETGKGILLSLSEPVLGQ